MRKLVLYSDQILPQTALLDQRLLSLIGKERPRIGYIPSQGGAQETYYRDRQVYYAQYGAELPVYCELDRDFRSEAVQALLGCDAIHLTGGNTFYFLYWLRARHMLEPLREYVARGGVLVGVSAGAILMTPDICTAAFCGDPPVVDLTDTSGLGLVDFAFVPHWGEIEAGPPDLVEYSRQHRTTVLACPDGSGIVVDGDRIERVGEVVEFINPPRRNL